MPFGKFRGSPLSELPDGYLEWLGSLDNLREPLRSGVHAELRRRQAVPADEIRALADDVVTTGFRVLALKCHPDTGGDTTVMALLNDAVTYLRRYTRGELAA